MDSTDTVSKHDLDSELSPTPLPSRPIQKRPGAFGCLLDRDGDFANVRQGDRQELRILRRSFTLRLTIRVVPVLEIEVCLNNNGEARAHGQLHMQNVIVLTCWAVEAMRQAAHAAVKAEEIVL